MKGQSQCSVCWWPRETRGLEVVSPGVEEVPTKSLWKVGHLGLEGEDCWTVTPGPWALLCTSCAPWPLWLVDCITEEPSQVTIVYSHSVDSMGLAGQALRSSVWDMIFFSSLLLISVLYVPGTVGCCLLDFSSFFSFIF